MHLHQAVAQDFASLHDARVYVCGPPPMVEAVKALALERGAAPQRVRADPFFAAAPPKRTLWQRLRGTERHGGLSGYRFPTSCLSRLPRWAPAFSFRSSPASHARR